MPLVTVTMNSARRPAFHPLGLPYKFKLLLFFTSFQVLFTSSFYLFSFYFVFLFSILIIFPFFFFCFYFMETQSLSKENVVRLYCRNCGQLGHGICKKQFSQEERIIIDAAVLKIKRSNKLAARQQLGSSSALAQRRLSECTV